ncbi:MAG: PhoH family protein [Bacteroidales bacterium]|nr:PhoH family protein [Bacteroidales bacterium]
MADIKKIFVLDTNVILHNHNCLYHFEENDIVIPIIVLEELDKFKKGNEQINFQAREFMRELDKLSGDDVFKEGVSLGENNGLLFIETGKPFSKEMAESFSETSPDHKILAVAEYIKNKYPKRQTIVVSQDINLRMKAKSLGIIAEGYRTGEVRDIEKIKEGLQTYDNVDNQFITNLYHEEHGIPAEELNVENKFTAHQYFILKNEKSSVLAHYDPFENKINKVTKEKASGINPRNAEQTFAIDALLRPEIKLISLTGKAGTGKTLLALAAALELKKDFNQILLARPIMAMGDKDLGYLPGSAKEKINPYMQPLFDNLNVIKNRFGKNSKSYSRIDDMLDEEKLVIMPLAYIRGRSLSNVFFIVDEAQNLTPHEIKTIITRAGEGTKMVFTGDIQQIDSPYLDDKSNGLSYLSDRMKGQDIFAHINLVKGERSYLADLASDLL